MNPFLSKRRSPRVTAFAFAAAWACGAIFPAPADAASRYWRCEDGSWQQSACWSTGVLPTASDFVIVDAINTKNQTLRLDSASGLRQVSGLGMGSTDGSAKAKLLQSGGTLQVIGPTTMASGAEWTMTGGQVKLDGVTLGLSGTSRALLQLNGGSFEAGHVWGGPGAQGALWLNGGNALIDSLVFASVANDTFSNLSVSERSRLEVMGEMLYDRAGSSRATVSGPLKVQTLVVGNAAEGAFSLRNSGSLQAATLELGRGAGSSGYFEQLGLGSDASVARLLVGVASGGRYEMKGGRLAVGEGEIGSANADGSFVHSGGTVNLGQRLVVGTRGVYELRGTGDLNTAGSDRTFLNQGLFVAAGGRFAGTLVNEGRLIWGSASDAAALTDFNGRLVNRGNVQMLRSGRFGDGMHNVVLFESLGKGIALAVDGSGLLNEGVMLMDGGTLEGNGTKTNRGQFLGHGRIAGTGAFVNGGSLEVSGGSLVIASAGDNRNDADWTLSAGRSLVLEGSGTRFSNAGAMALAGGSVDGAGSFTNTAGGVLVGSGTVRTSFSNAGTLALAGNDRVTVTNTRWANTGLVDLRGNGTLLAGGTIDNRGLIAGHGRIASFIDNTQGRVRAEGGVLVIATTLVGNGTWQAGTGGTLLVTGPLAEHRGTLQLEGGSFDANGQTFVNRGRVEGYGTLRTGAVQNHGELRLSGGPSHLHGAFTNLAGGKAIVSGGATATFLGALDATAGSELRVSTGSRAVFFGPVLQRSGASFTGGGVFHFEGGYGNGSNPARSAVDGDLLLGAGARVELGLASALSGLAVSGDFEFGGTLVLTAPALSSTGASWDLFDWGGAHSGRFGRIDTSAIALGDGQSWDFSRLYVDGSVTVVPEPGTVAMWLAGLAALGLTRRRRLAGAARRPAGRCGTTGRRVAAAAAAALSLAAAAPAMAADWRWDASSGLLPDAGGGFTLKASGSGSASFAGNGAMRLATEGPQSDWQYFEASGAQLEFTEPLVIEFTTRWMSGSSASSLRSGLMLSVSFGNHVGALLMIDERAAWFINGDDMSKAPGAQLDPLEFYTHRLVFSGSQIGDRVTHYTNGELRWHQPLQFGPTQQTAYPSIRFGDLSLYAGATSEWLDFHHNAAPVPEPGAASLVMLGLVGVWLARRRAAGSRYLSNGDLLSCSTSD